MSACLAHTADAQAKRRARSRYPARPYVDGIYVRGQKAGDGTWTPMPCSCAECLQAAPATRFATLEEGVQHELAALHARRATWRNLAPAKEVEKGQKSISRATIKGEEKIGVATAEGQQPMAKILKRWRSLSRVSEIAASEDGAAVGAVVVRVRGRILFKQPFPHLQKKATRQPQATPDNSRPQAMKSAAGKPPRPLRGASAEQKPPRPRRKASAEQKPRRRRKHELRKAWRQYCVEIGEFDRDPQQVAHAALKIAESNPKRRGGGVSIRPRSIARHHNAAR